MSSSTKEEHFLNNRNQYISAIAGTNFELSFKTFKYLLVSLLNILLISI